MIIKKLKETLGQVFHSPEASGTWSNDDIECAIDDNVVDCSEMDEEPYVGIPAPAYLEEDPWFGPAPIRSEKQLDYMEQETFIKQQEHQETHSTAESEDIHQVMYEMATQNSATTLQLNPIGGSENFQGGSENVHR
jgi:hypothetical protein|tara:strand:+ start:309 stop:716 length:408 start_codon:yes stop_codon:yes gene_type:complete